MKYFAKLYSYLLLTSKTDSEKINKNLIYFNFLSVEKVSPFLVFLLDMYQSKELSEKVILKIFKIIESYLFRMVICKKDLKTSFFANIQKDILINEKKDYFQTFKDSFKYQESLFGNNLPNNKEFEDCFKKTTYKTYYNKKRIHYILGKIECLNSKESFYLFNPKTSFQIEHIIPQTLSTEWEKDLNIKNKNELEDIFTLGNLTLTQENQEMGNKPFSYKRKIFANSSLKINQILSKKNKFSLEDVKERANFLFEKALQIWKNPLEEILEI